MLKLVYKQFAKAWVVQVTLVVLFASAIMIMMIYSAYVSRESMSISATVQSRIPQGYFLATVPSAKKVSGLPKSGYISLVAAWRDEIASTNLGRLPCVFLADDPSLTSFAPPGSAAVHRDLAAKLRIEIGDKITILSSNREINVNVIEIYDNTLVALGYGFGERVLVFTGEAEDSTSFFYQQTHSSDYLARYHINQAHPDCQLEDSSSDQGVGVLLVQSKYSEMLRAQISLITFIALGFLTAKMLSFLDGRKTIAMLKALGLRNNEVAKAIAAEALISPSLGIAVGIMVGWGLLKVLERQGTGLSFSPLYAINAASALVPAVVIGVIIPGRFSQVGTVVDLLFHRSIPLFYERVTTIEKRFPQLDELIAQGLCFLSLDTVEGKFGGFVFRKLGDSVKQGEVVAYDVTWWGLKVKTYTSPVNGTITVFQQDTGLIGIMPEGTL